MLLETIDSIVIGDDELQDLDLRLHAEKWMRDSHIPVPKRETRLWDRLYTIWEDELTTRIARGY